MTSAATSAISGMQNQSRRPLAWLLLVRILVVSLLLSGIILYQLRNWDEAHPLALRPFYLIAVLSYAEALVSALVLTRVERLRLFVQVQVVWDLLVAIALVYLTGGLNSPFPFLLLIVISSSSIFLSRRDVFFVAAAAAILYGSLLDLQYYRFLPDPGITPFPAQIATHDVFYAVYIHVTAFLATAFLSGVLVERLRRSEQARTQSEIDFREIENLNRTIQANIASGLMIVNPQGRIRAFNREAERLTGYRLGEVYDRSLRDLFPLFLQESVVSGSAVAQRAEGRYITRRGEERVLGFRVSPVFGPDGESLGQMVNFQDLTRIKTMEEQVKRADRLAAVGRLASGMAHEIRNPLASISGSIQLLLEQDYIREEDRRLMGIVVKEADRLSRLLTDFLIYARPPTPRREAVNLAVLLDELAAMIERDARFARVTIERRYPAEILLNVDAEQFRQVLWNLLRNACEACPEGTIRVEADPVTAQIVVEDSGPGIAEDIRGRIFEPFFTTKDQGTGLGLAMVYAIVDAHGGSIRVERGELGGARFVLKVEAA